MDTPETAITLALVPDGPSDVQGGLESRRDALLAQCTLLTKSEAWNNRVQAFASVEESHPSNATIKKLRASIRGATDADALETRVRNMVADDRAREGARSRSR